MQLTRRAIHLPRQVLHVLHHSIHQLHRLIVLSRQVMYVPPQTINLVRQVIHLPPLQQNATRREESMTHKKFGPITSKKSFVT